MALLETRQLEANNRERVHAEEQEEEEERGNSRDVNCGRTLIHTH